MPTSRSPKPNAKADAPAGRARFSRLLILLAVLAVLTVAVIALPASMVKRFLPPAVQADDFSGTLWHGSAGRISVDSRDAGAMEWRIHPGSLLGLTLAADLRWVKVGFVADGSADLDRHGVTAHHIEGSGPLEDLQSLGLGAGVRGTTSFKFSELKIVFTGSSVSVLSAVGDLNVFSLVIPQIASGADLGGYTLHMANVAITPTTDAAADLSDTGGPLELNAVIHFSANERTGILSGTVKERADAPPALRNQLDSLSQLHARDAEGRIPVELEFSF